MSLTCTAQPCEAYGALVTQRGCDRLLVVYQFLLFPSSIRTCACGHIARACHFPSPLVSRCRQWSMDRGHVYTISSLDLKTVHLQLSPTFPFHELEQGDPCAWWFSIQVRAMTAEAKTREASSLNNRVAEKLTCPS